MIAAPRIVELGPFSSEGATLIPWETTLDYLRRSQKYWLSTVRADGRPHVTPLLAVVALEGICFVTGSDEQKSRNLRTNPHVVLTTGVNNLTSSDAVVEGRAELVDDPARLEEAASALESALGWHVTAPDGTWHGMPDAVRERRSELWLVVPTKVFAHHDGTHFGQTRYVW